MNKCYCCDKETLNHLIDLGMQPNPNLLSDDQDRARALKNYSLLVDWCTNCSHVQISNSLPPAEMYEEYSYISPRGLFKHFGELVDYCGNPQFVDSGEALVRLRRVIDIGSNSGEMLRIFKEKGWQVLGVDPSQLAIIATENGIPTERMFFNSETAWKLPEADVITCLNCFGHGPDPFDFLRGIERTLRPGGFALIEFPYNLNLINNNCFDVYYFEHFSEFTVRSFTTLCERAGFKVDDLMFTDVHGGSLCFKISLGRGHCLKVRQAIRKEEDLLDPTTYEMFRSQVDYNIKEVSRLIKSHKEAGATIVAYGASAKATILFNHRLFDASNIDYIVDEAYTKIGKFAPGSGLEIKPPGGMFKEKNLVVLNTAWNYPIKDKLTAEGLNGNIITYIPDVQEEIF